MDITSHKHLSHTFAPHFSRPGRTLRKLASMLDAMARASRVLPVPERQQAANTSFNVMQVHQHVHA